MLKKNDQCTLYDCYIFLKQKKIAIHHINPLSKVYPIDCKFLPLLMLRIKTSLSFIEDFHYSDISNESINNNEWDIVEQKRRII